MKTQVIQVNQQYPDREAISYAARLIQEGKLVAFPTETVYGLGANALNLQAVSNIFAAKNRPADNPLIVHITNPEDIRTYAKNIPSSSWDLASAFWPGPLTLLLERKEIIPDIVTAGSNLVSLRIPNHPIALALLKAAGVPIAAPSANSSSKPSPTDAQHVLEDLDGKVDLILDAGPTDIGVESTVLDITSAPPMILRPGGVSLEMLQGILPLVASYGGNDEKPRSPGMKYKHYSPSAVIVLYVGNTIDVIQRMVADYSEGSTEVISDTPITGIPQDAQHILPSAKEYAKNIFALFRNVDKKGVKKILIKGIEEKELGAAVMNRLKKAATEIISA